MNLQNDFPKKNMDKFENYVKINNFPVCPQCHQKKCSKINPFYNMCFDCIKALRKNQRGQSKYRKKK